MDLDRSLAAAVPETLRTVLSRAVALAEQDERAVGLIVNGSVGVGRADRFSDLDLLVAYADGAAADLPALARRFAGQLGDVLVAFTGEHVGEPALVIALLGDPLVHVDVKCAPVSAQAERVEDGLVIWQRGTAVDDARAGTTPHWPQRDPQWMEDRFWVWVHYAAVKAGRGELLECLDALALLRNWVLGPLITAGRSASPSGVRRLESLAPDLLAELHATIGGPDAGHCLDALVAAADLYRRVRPAGVETHDRAEAAVRGYLTELRAELARR